MENVVNLEQLDYRDQMIKEYIDEHSSGGTGRSLWCELEVSTIYTEEENTCDEAHLYIKCYKGTILESDELQFARNTATPTWYYTGNTNEYGNPEKILVKKRRGWIVPKPYNLVRLYKVYAEEKSAASELYDYWEVLPKNRNDEPMTWQELLDEFLNKRHQFHMEKGTENAAGLCWCGDSFTNNYASFVNRWCGVAVKRDGKIISDYMKWQITGPACGNRAEYNQSGSMSSPYTSNGTYAQTMSGEKVTAYYHFSLKH